MISGYIFLFYFSLGNILGYITAQTPLDAEPIAKGVAASLSMYKGFVKFEITD